MRLKKALWWARLILETPFWGKVGRKSYIGRPAMLTGIKRIHVGANSTVRGSFAPNSVIAGSPAKLRSMRG